MDKEKGLFGLITSDVIQWLYLSVHRPVPVSAYGHTRDVGVQCRDDQDGVKTIRAAITNPVHTVKISWSLGNSTQAGEPILFKIERINEKYSIAISVNNQTSTINLGGLLPSTSYTTRYYAFMYRILRDKGSSFHTNVRKLFYLCDIVITVLVVNSLLMISCICVSVCRSTLAVASSIQITLASVRRARARHIS